MVAGVAIGLLLWALAGWLVSGDSPAPDTTRYRLDLILPLIAALLMLGVANTGLIAGFMLFARWALGRAPKGLNRNTVMTGIIERALFTSLMILFIGTGRANRSLFQTGELVWGLLILSGAYVLFKSIRINQPSTATRLVQIESLWGAWISVGLALIAGWYFWKLHDVMT